jgi:hypothetical protein
MQQYRLYYGAALADEHGEWCKHEDADAEIANLRAELEAVRARIAELEAATPPKGDRWDALVAAARRFRWPGEPGRR